MIRQLATIVFVLCGLYSYGQDGRQLPGQVTGQLPGQVAGQDTICLPRSEVMEQVNALAACDSSIEVATEWLTTRDKRIAELEESRSELMMQIDLHKRVRVNMEAESDVLRDDLKATRSEVVRAKLVTRVVAAAAVVAEIATVYLLVR